MATLKRFWASRDAMINLGDNGYLVDPESKFGKLLNPQAEQVDFLSATQCLILLGEPGIGKSFTMKAAHAEVFQRVTEAGEGDRVLWLDLHEVGSEQQLNRSLFDAPEFKQWRKGSTRLHLFLDSFDECRAHIKTLTRLLISELRKCDTTRLNLRIACRTTDWPSSFETDLQHMFGEDKVKVRELLPLRRVDVRTVAQEARDIDSDVFLSAVERANGVPFAIKPVTLRFLIEIYRRNGSLSARQEALYREGCRILCEETNERREVGLKPTLNAYQRLAVARRIAALTVFGNRAAVWTAADLGDVPPDDVTIDAITGDIEYANGGKFDVISASVEETLNTGLFASRGQNRLGWAHQTFAEFLAADYLVKRDLELPQIMSLIVHPRDPEGKIVPQLHETAAWLASLRPDVFTEILQRDPEVLLHSDVASASDADRKALVEALLRGYDAGTLLDDDSDLQRRYARLNHPSLAEQLRRVIRNRSKGLVVRRVAISTAEECHLTALLNDLVAVALDPTESHQIRVYAAYAVTRIGDLSSRAKLKPLVFTDPNDDPDDQLKGWGLQACWPDCLTASELFAALTRPRGNLIGAYRGFLLSDPMLKLQPADLPLALQWGFRTDDCRQRAIRIQSFDREHPATGRGALGSIRN